VEPLVMSVVAPDHAHSVPSPAYDSLTPQQRLAWREEHPHSYLNVTRSPEDEPDDAVGGTDALLSASRAALDRLMEIGAFDEARSAMFAYELELGDHRQLGLVAGVAVDDFAAGNVRAHEHIRTERMHVLADHLEVVGAQSSPVALAADDLGEAGRVLGAVTTAEPLLEITDQSGVRQRIWAIDAAADIGRCTEALAAQPLYLIDGHHRGAAAIELQRRNPGAASAGQLLSVIFPAHELRVLEYNRWLHGIDAQRWMGDIVDRFAMAPSQPGAGDSACAPGEFAMFGDGQWYRGRFADGAVRQDAIGPGEILDHLDPVVLERTVLAPVLAHGGVLDHLAGGQPLERLEALVRDGGGLAFALAPVDFGDIRAIADAGLVLPPKSTYFHPKVRSGVFLRQLNL
jgi:uncharacterized protein (DUF1015 family)